MLLFVQNARPALQETLDFIENQVVVEMMTKAPTKVADTVNNVLDDTKKTEKIRCWATQKDRLYSRQEISLLQEVQDFRAFLRGL